MRYLLPDGKTVSGRSYRDITIAMASEKFTPVADLNAYRRATAHRVSLMYGRDISSATDRDFVLSLVDVGVLVKLK